MGVVGRIHVHMGGVHPGLGACTWMPRCQGEPLAGLDGSAESWMYQERKTM